MLHRVIPKTDMETREEGGGEGGGEMLRTHLGSSPQSQPSNLHIRSWHPRIQYIARLPEENANSLIELLHTYLAPSYILHSVTTRRTHQPIGGRGGGANAYVRTCDHQAKRQPPRVGGGGGFVRTSASPAIASLSLPGEKSCMRASQYRVYHDECSPDKNSAHPWSRRENILRTHSE